MTSSTPTTTTTIIAILDEPEITRAFTYSTNHAYTVCMGGISEALFPNASREEVDAASSGFCSKDAGLSFVVSGHLHWLYLFWVFLEKVRTIVFHPTMSHLLVKMEKSVSA